VAEKVKLYKKNAITVEGLRWDGSNLEQMQDFTDGNFRISKWRGAQVYDRLHDSWIKVFPGNSVLRGTQNEYYPIDARALKDTYTELR
jgi:hypothetical protein